MNKEIVDTMLSNYRDYLARCEYLDSEIPELERLASHMRERMIEDSIHVTQTLSDLPHGTDISDPTGHLALMFASGGVTDHVRQIEEEIAKKKREREQKKISVHFVDAWLKSLNEKEKLLVEKQVIDKLYWREVIRHYENAFGELYSKHALKAIRDKALKRIYDVAQ